MYDGLFLSKIGVIPFYGPVAADNVLRLAIIFFGLQIHEQVEELLFTIATTLFATTIKIIILITIVVMATIIIVMDNIFVIITVICRVSVHNQNRHLSKKVNKCTLLATVITALQQCYWNKINLQIAMFILYFQM